MNWKNRIVELRHVKPSDLKKNPANWRDHPAIQKGALEGVLSEVGVVMPWLLNQRSTACGWPAGSEPVLIDGHLRTDMAVESGQTQVPVIVVDLSELEERMVLASLDPIGALATTNAEKLKEVIAGLSTRSKGLEQLIDKQRRLVQRLTTESASGDGNTKASLPDELGKKWGTAAGQLWRIPSIAGPGEHRILCGDSTSMADMDRLCGDVRPKLLATDPPYLVDYNGGNHPDKRHFSKTGHMSTSTKEWDDYIDPEASVDFYRDFLRVALAHCDDNIAVYQWHASRRQHLVDEAWRLNNIIHHQQVIWRKSHPVLTRCHMLWQHEPALYGWVQGKPPKHRPPNTATTVWEIAHPGHHNEFHPTQKPIEIFAWPIRWHTEPGETVLEPFSGSGTQLVAAEQEGRICFAMEMSPPFVASALERMSLAGCKPELLEPGDGRVIDVPQVDAQEPAEVE